MSEGWKRAFRTACQNAKIENLRFHDIRHTFVTRKVREGWDYKRIMAITGHKTFAVFQWYNNPSEEDVKEGVAAPLPVMVQRKSRRGTLSMTHPANPRVHDLPHKTLILLMRP